MTNKGTLLEPTDAIIPLCRPSLGKEELKAVAATFASGWIGPGRKTALFEQEFASYIGTTQAIAVSSCTAALDLALKALKISSGEVLVPAITFASTALACLYNGLKPVFVDVDHETLCIDPADLQRKITDNSRAMIPVHLAGHPVDMQAISEICSSRKLPIIEDCAEAAGALYRNRKIGSLGDIGCFSFEAKKNMTTGDGGMITTNSHRLAERLRLLRDLGIGRPTWQRITRTGYSWYYQVKAVGFKANMNDIEAAIGLVQLRRLDAMNDRRRRIAQTYSTRLKTLPLELPTEKPWARSVWWLYIVRVERRTHFIESMRKQNVTTGVHFMPLYRHPVFRMFKSDCPEADTSFEQIVSLPVYPDMSPDTQKAIITAVSKTLSA